MLKLSLSNNTIRDSAMPAMIVEDHEDEWSTYKLLRMYIARAHYPGWTGLLFMRKCPAKYLKKRQSNVNAEAIKNKVATYTAHQGDCSPRSKGKMAGTCKGKMGISFPSIIYKRLAHRCGFINPDKFTGRSARRSGISKLVSLARSSTRWHDTPSIQPTTCIKSYMMLPIRVLSQHRITLSN